MSYKKQNFVDGLPLFAAQLNHIEDGIVELEKLISEDTTAATSIELLWRNADTASDFDAQQVALNLSKYDFVFIIFVAQTGASTHIATGFVRIGGGEYSAEYITNSGSANKRSFRATTASVNFNIGRQGTSTGVSYMIPKEIYGVKGALA